MQMLPCWNCTVLSYLQALGCSDRAQYHISVGKKREAAAVGLWLLQ